MAKFDYYERRNGPGFLLDCQADLLSGLNTRFVVPLLPLDEAPRPAARLNPVFELQGTRHAMVTQFAAAVLVKELGDCAGSLAAEQDRIIDAVDMLLSGF